MLEAEAGPIDLRASAPCSACCTDVPHHRRRSQHGDALRGGGAPGGQEVRAQGGHKARLMLRPFLMREELRWREDEEACERTKRLCDLGIASLLSHRKRDVVEASETRHVPRHGEMVCDCDIDPAALASALPDDVLRRICDEHARALCERATAVRPTGRSGSLSRRHSGHGVWSIMCWRRGALSGSARYSAK